MIDYGAIIFSIGALLLCVVLVARMNDRDNPFVRTFGAAAALMAIGWGMMG